MPFDTQSKHRCVEIIFAERASPLIVETIASPPHPAVRTRPAALVELHQPSQAVCFAASVSFRFMSTRQASWPQRNSTKRDDCKSTASQFATAHSHFACGRSSLDG
jgi:hypothetical protein